MCPLVPDPMLVVAVHFRTPSQPRMFFHSGHGGMGIDQEHQGSHVHQGEWPIPKQELGENFSYYQYGIRY